MDRNTFFTSKHLTVSYRCRRIYFDVKYHFNVKCSLKWWNNDYHWPQKWIFLFITNLSRLIYIGILMKWLWIQNFISLPGSTIPYCTKSCTNNVIIFLEKFLTRAYWVITIKSVPLGALVTTGQSQAGCFTTSSGSYAKLSYMSLGCGLNMIRL